MPLIDTHTYSTVQCVGGKPIYGVETVEKPFTDWEFSFPPQWSPTKYIHCVRAFNAFALVRSMQIHIIEKQKIEHKKCSSFHNH